MMFEDAQFEMEMYNIDPSLTCRCDEVHVCQQCLKEIQETQKLKNSDNLDEI